MFILAQIALFDYRGTNDLLLLGTTLAKALVVIVPSAFLIGLLYSWSVRALPGRRFTDIFTITAFSIGLTLFILKGFPVALLSTMICLWAINIVLAGEPDDA